MASVSFEHVEKTYPNGHRAIADFNLDIRDGELMVLVGPSGCGKSTLLRLVAGLEEITSGLLRIGLREANRLTPQDRNIAMVFQDYALYPTMTVRANLEFPLKMRRLARAELRRRVAWVAELLALGDVLDRLPKQLSGGQRQRVAMGRALVREPSVFLLDEPLSNLDAKLRTQVRAEIGELQRRMGTTMIYVTHDQVEAMTLGQRIAVLQHGQIQQVAGPKELYEHPRNAFVAGFLGSPAMNLCRAELTRGEDRAWLVSLHGQILGRVLDLPSLDKALPADRPGFPPKSPRAAATQVHAGLRPEALRLAGPSEQGFSAVVVSSEYLGHETLLHFHPGRPGQVPAGFPPWTARLPGMHRFAKDETVDLVASPDGFYWFAGS